MLCMLTNAVSKALSGSTIKVSFWTEDIVKFGAAAATGMKKARNQAGGQIKLGCEVTFSTDGSENVPQQQILSLATESEHLET